MRLAWAALIGAVVLICQACEGHIHHPVEEIVSTEPWLVERLALPLNTSATSEGTPLGNQSVRADQLSTQLMFPSWHLHLVCEFRRQEGRQQMLETA
jgi:hypothetical protein